ncbi:hypothetical protein RHSIM_Rhsim05G0147500 [Rhododendron simsii]|uniref:PGG domain-containing protein n=1 Tax=Rhododendron simsii TaxID=118357 RepID=A0A834GZ24_RHOSS|nr:hypothetical protein RHSIM_Rhsim05G0147500 [Rhododendron simsii]
MGFTSLRFLAVTTTTLGCAFSPKRQHSLPFRFQMQSLFTSTTSLLMFFSILTSRYAESDFLYVLPKRLIIGLFTLFLSMTSMIVASSATLYLAFGHDKFWILILVAILASLPVTSFASLQFSLLIDLISLTPDCYVEHCLRNFGDWSSDRNFIFDKESSGRFPVTSECSFKQCSLRLGTLETFAVVAQ